ncbi:MAG TPA: hypothetical protein VFR81_24750 [Longimicrobium sp.]|nr:hypothetical protein [Longimicrobium sp.]
MSETGTTRRAVRPRPRIAVAVGLLACLATGAWFWTTREEVIRCPSENYCLVLNRWTGTIEMRFTDFGEWAADQTDTTSLPTMPVDSGMYGDTTKAM